MEPKPEDLDHIERKRFSKIGITKDSVLPLPVFAAPSMSLPASECGNVADCILV
eukprot:CAMPEP_0118634234 /NCGR_PEP_ID=MMETSP0785-20121206/1427_1 /TAXON_ID=91992 /ORGANISM="Bolidomonas pacifica, Strain CCMP 1866" /LENGTH=53 /DNA_ID=CAMNT_0006525173 /DNA_START=64 /DNA_END=225 /DNA_ORIENTATION=+